MGSGGDTPQAKAWGLYTRDFSSTITKFYMWVFDSMQTGSKTSRTGTDIGAMHNTEVELPDSKFPLEVARAEIMMQKNIAARADLEKMRALTSLIIYSQVLRVVRLDDKNKEIRHNGERNGT